MKIGTLFLLGGFFAVSSVVRLAGVATDVWAKTEAKQVEAVVPITPPKQCAPDPDLAPLMSALKSREDAVSEAEHDLELRLGGLGVAEQRLAEKLAELEEAEERLAATISRAQTAAKDDVTRLAEVYQNMKPKDAAAVFQQMEPEFAAGFLGVMDATAAAAIMGGIDPTSAYRISVLLAGRNVNVPTE